MPQRATLPPGFNLKHVHGGPSYVYVISGSLDIIGADGTKATYRAGDFFWEPVGRTHTAQTSEGAELFILRFVVPGAEGTVPVK
jgi:quercetin dioxygenase-like cupin family protein